MKRAWNLIESIVSPNNLRLAFIKASRGKRAKREVLRFRDDLDKELRCLSAALLRGEVDWGPYHLFRICDPKERTIAAAPFRTRVAHHAIINVCEPIFESYQIEDSCACRKGKGLDRALERALRFSRAGGWFMKMDISKYFDSIDHDVLRSLLSRLFKDRAVLDLFDSIISTHEVMPGKGVPIGNLTSQYFANHYLALLDHFVKEKLRCRRYVRYMDDFVIWSTEKSDLLDAQDEVGAFLQSRLKLQLKPVWLNSCDRGMTFLGYRIFPNGISLARRSRDRFRRKFIQCHRLFAAGIWNERDLVRHIEPLLAFVRRGASRAFRERVIQESGLCSEARTA